MKNKVHWFNLVEVVRSLVKLKAEINELRDRVESLENPVLEK